ncbi:MAG: helix-turn-helix transcriptional regulator [Candidatus Gastranaerophilales bacterium]|nr:helix-turn-helix transcriptional regulator [Candidatus Gastranaerophilales bacterium]
MYNLESTGLKIKEIRKRKKISQEKLAEMVSMNTRSILRLENAQNIPTIETLDKIAKALNVSISDFFETQTTKNKDEIIEDINKCLLMMNTDELKNFYKAVYYFIH